MVDVEPVIGAPAATVTLGDRRLLLLADYHAGIELGFRYRDGLHVASRADDRLTTLLDLIEELDVDEVVVLGDLMHSIGSPAYDERAEIERLVEALPGGISLTVIKGNHDGELEQWLERATVLDAPGTCRDGLALSHGHTWPPEDALEAEVLVIGHEHPQVRLEDAVGGAAIHRVWLRGRLRVEPIADHFGLEVPPIGPELIVMPAFNELSGGTFVNLEDEDFLVPYLPECLSAEGVYLLDGTLLGPLGTV